MSEDKSECFPNQFYVGSPHEDKATNIPDERDDVPNISFQILRSERPYESKYHTEREHSPSRISVHDFTLPKFKMRLAANQGNLQKLASLLAGKRTKEKRCLRPKLKELSGNTQENAAIPVDSSVYHLEQMDKTKKYAFPDALPEF